MDERGWYLLVYDIADPRRLQRVHRRLCRSGLPLQESVFAVFTSIRGLAELLDELQELMHKREDDLRAYPIAHPGEIWFQGRCAVEGPLLAPAGAPALPPGVEADTPSGLRRFLTRLRHPRRDG